MTAKFEAGLNKRSKAYFFAIPCRGCALESLLESSDPISELENWIDSGDLSPDFWGFTEDDYEAPLQLDLILKAIQDLHWSPTRSI